MENNTFVSRDRSTRGALVGLISQTIQLQPFVDGDNRLRGACPWHPDVARSLHATDSARQRFAYRAGGNAVDWIMRRDAVDKTQAGKDSRNLSFQNNEVGRGGASSRSINALGALSSRSQRNSTQRIRIARQRWRKWLATKAQSWSRLKQSLLDMSSTTGQTYATGVRECLFR